MKIKLLITLGVSALIGVGNNAKAQFIVNDPIATAQTAAQHIMQYTNMAAQYAKQVQEYQTQLEQFDLQQVAARVFDTGQFDSTMRNLDSYKSAFDVNDSKSKLGGLPNYSDFTSGGPTLDSEQYLRKLGQATDRKLALSKAQSELVTRRMDSVETDRSSLTRLQNANANAQGQMEAAQIGNHINSEMVGQLVKMRQEQASVEQARLEKEALSETAEAEEIARTLKSYEENKLLTEEYINESARPLPKKFSKK